MPCARTRFASIPPAVVVLACLLAALLAGFAAQSAGATTAPAVGAGKSLLGRAKASSTHFRFFSPSSFWNTPLAAGARLEPGSGRIVTALASEVEAERRVASGPWISTTRFSVPIYTVGANQPAVRVELTSPIHSPALQAAFERVPLPPGAKASGGTDGHLVVWQPSTDRLWEFWRLVRTPQGPAASWGGAIERVSTSSGVYGPESWPDAEPWWGASASSLSVAGGLITLEDLRLGEIDHALAIALPEIRAGVYSLPAKRTDGKSSDPLALPEGARLRLDPSLDVAALDLPRTTRLIAEAAQRYGLVVRDGSSIVQFFAEDPVSTGGNPYAGPGGYFDGRYPHQLLADFPWQRLRVLKMELRPDDA